MRATAPRRARRHALAAAVLLQATFLAGCGDDASRREAAIAFLAKGLGGEVSTPSASSVSDGRYAVSPVSWKGSHPGRAASAEVTRSASNAVVLAVLRDVTFDTGATASAMSVEGGSDGRSGYRISGIRISAWGVTAEIGDAVVEIAPDSPARVTFSGASFSAGPGMPSVVTALLARWAGKGPVDGNIDIMRRDGSLRINARRLGPVGGDDGLRLHAEAAIPHTKSLELLAPGDVALSGASARLGSALGATDRAATVPDLPAMIGGGDSIGVDIASFDPIPLTGILAALPELAARGSLRISTDPRPGRQEAPGGRAGPDVPPGERPGLVGR